MLEVHTDEQCSCTCLKCPIKLFLFQSHASNQMYTVQDTLVGVYMYFEQILASFGYPHKTTVDGGFEAEYHES